MPFLSNASRHISNTGSIHSLPVADQGPSPGSRSFLFCSLRWCSPHGVWNCLCSCISACSPRDSHRPCCCLAYSHEITICAGVGPHVRHAASSSATCHASIHLEQLACRSGRPWCTRQGACNDRPLSHYHIASFCDRRQCRCRNDGSEGRERWRQKRHADLEALFILARGH